MVSDTNPTPISYPLDTDTVEIEEPVRIAWYHSVVSLMLVTWTDANNQTFFSIVSILKNLKCLSVPQLNYPSKIDVSKFFILWRTCVPTDI